MAKCNCINEVESKIKEHYQEQENIENVTKSNIDNVALMFTPNGGNQFQLYSQVNVEYDYTNKKGQIKHKKVKVNASYKYCPFCGKPYEG
jgi:formate dehydrogenase maturation protein FdhE